MHLPNCAVFLAICLILVSSLVRGAEKKACVKAFGVSKKFESLFDEYKRRRKGFRRFRYIEWSAPLSGYRTTNYELNMYWDSFSKTFAPEESRVAAKIMLDTKHGLRKRNSLSISLKSYPKGTDLEYIYRLVLAHALEKFEDRYIDHIEPELSKAEIANAADNLKKGMSELEVLYAQPFVKAAQNFGFWLEEDYSSAGLMSPQARREGFGPYYVRIQMTTGRWNGGDYFGSPDLGGIR